MTDEKTAAGAGWHSSRYNLSARIPEEDKIVMINLLSGSCAVYSLQELLALSSLDRIPADSPVLTRLKNNGILVRYDEQAALETLSRAACAFPNNVSLTICPTMACNFACPYCFETHRTGKMSTETQDRLVALAERLLDVSHVKTLSVTWFGGEPLLQPDLIEALSERLIDLAQRKEVTYHARIISNGYLLTQEIADMLGRVKVASMQITLDGIGAMHDKTRRLKGGGSSFGQIEENLRTLHLPFSVDVRHNLYEANVADAEPLRQLVRDIAAQSGNSLSYYPYAIHETEAAIQRGEQLTLCREDEYNEVRMQFEAGRFKRGRGHYCGAHSVWTLSVDELGNLYKCWEDIGRDDRSFGKVSSWDPADPFATADNPDILTAYLNSSGVLDDPVCRSCVWLPACRGGCPKIRFRGERPCVPYKNYPKEYVAAVYKRLKQKSAAGRAEESKP